MGASDFIVSVTEADFDFEVIAFSQRVPVVVDFWAAWCVPCKVISPILEKLASEAKGLFRLAKVNVDENPKLAFRYNVRGIPVIKAFRDGQVVSEFSGVQPEPRVREFLRALAPSRSDLALERAMSLIQSQKWTAAETGFRQVLADQPENPAALLGLGKSLIVLGRAAEAETVLRKISPSREYAAAETLLALVDVLLAQPSVPDERDEPLDAAYHNALHLVERGNLLAAMDGILDVLRQDKRYRSGEPRRVIVGLLEILGDEHPQTRQYRNELASVLF